MVSREMGVYGEKEIPHGQAHLSNGILPISAHPPWETNTDVGEDAQEPYPLQGFVRERWPAVPCRVKKGHHIGIFH